MTNHRLKLLAPTDLAAKFLNEQSRGWWALLHVQHILAVANQSQTGRSACGGEYDGQAVRRPSAAESDNANRRRGEVMQWQMLYLLPTKPLPAISFLQSARSSRYMWASLSSCSMPSIHRHFET